MEEKIINFAEVENSIDLEKNKNIREILSALDLIEHDPHKKHVLREIILDKFNNYNRFINKKIKDLVN